jgi:cation diffusion facilitator family transporter
VNFPSKVDLNREELAGRRLALLSMITGFVLAASKLIVGFHAHSAAVVSDGLEASGDVVSSAFVYAGLWLANKPPDEEHPYGHGRYETLASLAVGGMLLLTGAAILWKGLTFSPPEHDLHGFAVYPLLAAIVVKVGQAWAKFRIGARIHSSGLQADAWHDLTDLLSTSVALLAVLLALWNPVRFQSADQVGAVAIGVLILFLSARVVQRTVDSLLDTMPEASKLSEIKDVALSIPGTRGIEKCLARRTGLRYHVDLHLEVDPEMTVRQSHHIATQVKIAIKETLPWVADVLVHVEPAATLEQAALRH